MDRPGWKVRFVRALTTLSVAVYLVPATLAFGTLAVLFSWIPPRGNVMCFLARLWARGALVAAGCRVRVVEEPGLEVGRGYVVMANHASYFDVLAMLAVLPGQYRFVAKRSLFFIPIFGWSLWAGGFIPVDRKNRSRAREIWAAAGKRLAAGSSVLFYPEGTRSADGRVHAFQRGAFLVALHNGAPILPVGISGARPIMPRHRLAIQPGEITVHFGTPVETSDHKIRDKDELIQRVRQEVAHLAQADLA
jgi:1-acyl-sn-glycerol-3-phosphate acyltransferase